MPLLTETIPIEVEVPAWDRDDQTSTFTKLFRVGSYLPEAMQLAIERKGDADISVGFAACSVGAEVDGLLTHYRKFGYQGRVDATGFDINGQAVSAAQAGIYTVIAESPKMKDRYREILEEHGFTVESHPEEGKKIPNGAGTERGPGKIKLLKADAGQIRKSHGVVVVQHDLSEPLPGKNKKDLMFANNLLYHLDEDQQARIIRNLGHALEDHGVLSLGVHTTEENQAVLEESGLKPVFSVYSGNIPVMFGRE